MKKMPRKGQNFELLKALKASEKTSLGGKSRSHAKRARPIAPRSTCHLVLKSQKAKGNLSFLNKRNKDAIFAIVKKQARKYFVRIDRFANVGNHLHLKTYMQHDGDYRNFLRSITCLIARHVTRARRGHKFGVFWDALAFTRTLKTYTEHQILDRYILANKIEGSEGRKEREDFLQAWYGIKHLANAPPLLLS